jgi:hypothetical protein
MNLGEIIEQRVANKKAIDDVNAQLKELNKQKSELDWNLIQTLDQQGQTKAANDVASVAVREEVVPQVENWEQFFEWLAETRNFEVLQRRLSSTACRELWALGVAIPGVTPRELRKIAIRVN